jgi:drug/metabolite transporter (DMT)-like permease
VPEQNPRQGILLMLAALFLFACLDATAKHLSHTYPIPLLVWARYTLHCLLMVIFLAPSMRWRLLETARPVSQVVRALMLVGTTGFCMAAFRLMPLAETTSIVFVTPVAVSLLAGPILGERVGGLRWAAVVAGFAGVLAIARPGSELSAGGIAFALAAAACYTVYQLQTRLLSPRESPVTMLFYTALVGTVVMTMALPWIARGPLPTLADSLLIATLGLYGGTGHYLLTRAFRVTPASTLSPFLYTQLIWATLLGWQVFGDLPDATTAVGMAVIAASGLAVAFAGARIGRTA